MNAMNVMNTSNPMNAHHSVYLLKSTTTRRTYIGYTVNPVRRLRQHNGEIKGGAKYTRRGRPWVMICYITGFPDHRTALQYEWKNHHPGKGMMRRGAGVPNRLSLMKKILNLERFTRTCVPVNSLNLMMVWLDPSYRKYWK